MDLIAALKRVFFTAGSSAASADSRVPILDANGNAIGSDKMTNILGAGSLLSAAKSIVSALTSRTGTSTTAAQGQNLYAPLYDDSGTVVNKIAITELAAFAAVTQMGGVFIMTHRKLDGHPTMYKPDKWTAQQNAGEVADGVVVVEGGHVLVVAPTESTTKLNWSSANVAGGGVTTINRETAYSDFAGKANTASQITHAEMSGEGYAAGFCHAYSRVNAIGKGLTAGKWWLPSLGEMMMIYANMTKINYALSLIEGATQLEEDAYWTSTEYSATNAWILRIFNGILTNYAKATETHRVRPVSAFIS